MGFVQYVRTSLVQDIAMHAISSIYSHGSAATARPSHNPLLSISPPMSAVSTSYCEFPH